VQPDLYTPLGGPASYVAQTLKPLLGWLPIVTVYTSLGVSNG
jgi:hypothetical protein